jgi:dTDP-4-dehydrorhamnose reductase
LKILLTGGSGLLALNWACAMRDRHEIVLAIHTAQVSLAGTTSVPLPLDQTDELRDALQRIAPDVVVHTAGLTSVDECERRPDASRHVNAELARNVAAALAGTPTKLVHISTDHLFKGTHAYYDEEAQPEPLNAYAATKLLAEHWVAAAYPEALIVRTNFFGWGHARRQSFSDWLYYNLAAERELTLFDDSFITPILADDLAIASHRLVESGASGIYNVAGDERVSKYDFGICLAEAYGFSKALLRRGKIAASQLSARRPPDMSLDNRKARDRLGNSLGTIAGYIRALQQQDLAGRRKELLAAIQD